MATGTAPWHVPDPVDGLRIGVAVRAGHPTGLLAEEGVSGELPVNQGTDGSSTS